MKFLWGWLIDSADVSHPAHDQRIVIVFDLRKTSIILYACRLFGLELFPI